MNSSTVRMVIADKVNKKLENLTLDKWVEERADVLAEVKK